MKRLVFVVIAVLCVNSHCLAESKSTKKKAAQAKEAQQKEKEADKKSAPVKEVVKEAPIKFSMKMLEGNTFSSRYEGPQIDQVIQAVEKLTNVTKGEFESTAEFNARKAGAISANFLDNMYLNDTFAFVVPVNKGYTYLDGLNYNFDADAGETQFFAMVKNTSLNGIGGPHYTRPKSFLDRPKFDHFSLKREAGISKTYMASNAYGATIEVTETSSTYYGVASENISFLTYKREIVYRNPVPSAKAKMDSKKAQKELPVLKAILVMKASEPYLIYDFMHKEPKRDSPTELSIQSKYLSGEVLGIVFYSGLTGEIFARIPEDFGKAVVPSATQPQDGKPSTLSDAGA